MSVPVIVISAALSASQPADVAPGMVAQQAGTAVPISAPATPVVSQPVNSQQPPVTVVVPAIPAVPSTATPPVAQPDGTEGGEIVVTGETAPPPQDPMERVNEKSFEVVQKVDDKLIAPIAHGYEKGVPRPVRMGLRNFIRNLTEPVVFLNYMLQLKPGKAAETLGRFAVNSTVGVAGLVDVAKKKPFNLPYRPNGLGNTLGYYGVGPGPYLYLPLVGPTTVRDLFGLFVDRATVPFAVRGPFKKPQYVLPLNIVESIDDRLQIDDELKEMKAASNPYVTYRELYLKARHDEIEALHGRGPLAKGESGVAPFAKPLHPAPADENGGTAASDVTATVPAPGAVAPVASTAPVVPAAPTFVAVPVVQPLPAASAR